jgi:hypothetical protein
MRTAGPPALTAECHVESLEAEGVREFLQLLVKTQKALRLYQPGNAVSDRLEEECFSRLSAHLEDLGPLEFAIREFQLLWNGEVVYESQHRKDSLAHLLLGHGIRTFSLYPGLERPEFHSFLECLNRVATLANDQDDLVTLFWQQDFQAIRYVAIDELNVETRGLGLQGQIAFGSLEGSERAQVVPDVVGLNDLQQPVSHLPFDACQLTEEEIEALQGEVAKEETDGANLAIVDLAIELTLHETSEEEQQTVADQLVAIVNRILLNGDLRAVADSVEHLSSFTEVLFNDSEPVGRLRARLFRALAEPEPLARFLEQVELGRSLRPEEVTAYLARVGRNSLPSIIPLMGLATTLSFRRAVSKVLIDAREDSIGPISQWLTSRETVSEPGFLREVLHVLVHLPGDGVVPLVEGLLRVEDDLTRRETARALGRFKQERIDDLCLDLLEQEDAEVRAAALDTLVRHGRRKHARPLLDRALGARGFAERPLSEKRRTFAAVAKLAGEQALEWFLEVLRPDERPWFVSRTEREMMAAAAHGIRMIGTDTTWQLLRDLAGSGDRFLKAACSGVLSERRT